MAFGRTVHVLYYIENFSALPGLESHLYCIVLQSEVIGYLILFSLSVTLEDKNMLKSEIRYKGRLRPMSQGFVRPSLIAFLGCEAEPNSSSVTS